VQYDNPARPGKGGVDLALIGLRTFLEEARMKKVLVCLAAVAVFAAVPARAADSWKGKISDSACNAKHPGGEHDGKKMTDAQCTAACIKDHDAKYVFVGDGDKVYKIANQDYAGLKTHAGHNVTVSGTMKDDTVTITKIEMPASKK
jgi:hypothetical protein